MTPDELRSAAVDLYGARGWVAALATRLSKDRTQIWRYLRGETPIPPLVAEVVTSDLKAKRSVNYG
jgi:hypothetical protein